MTGKVGRAVGDPDQRHHCQAQRRGAALQFDQGEPGGYQDQPAGEGKPQAALHAPAGGEPERSNGQPEDEARPVDRERKPLRPPVAVDEPRPEQLQRDDDGAAEKNRQRAPRHRRELAPFVSREHERDAHHAAPVERRQPEHGGEQHRDHDGGREYAVAEIFGHWDPGASAQAFA